MKNLLRTGLLGFLCLLAAALLPAVPADAQTLPLDAALDETPGADIFVMPREALFREKPALTARVISRLSAGARLKLLATGERFLHVEIATPTPDSGGQVSGYLAREVTAAFPPGADGTRDLAIAGRILARSETYRRLATAFLMRAAERSRDAGVPDPRLEVLLGETAEALAAAGGPFPPGLEVVRPPATVEEGTRYLYRGDAFERALELTSRASAGEFAAVRERAMAGLLRARYPETSASLALLWQETAAWLQLTESACDPAALSCAADRLGVASLALGRYLLATGKLEQIKTMEERVRAAGGRVAAVLGNKTRGRKLAGTEPAPSHRRRARGAAPKSTSWRSKASSDRLR